MAKIDLKKEQKALYNPPSDHPVMVEVPQMNFLAVDGSGNPNTSQEFVDAVESLYSVSYGLKFAAKKAGNDYVVMPLEGLFWADDMSAFVAGNKDAWKWTMMIAQPGFITSAMVEQASEAVRKKKGLKIVPRFEAFSEGLSAQIMHLGPYSAEAPTVQKLHAFIRESGYTFRGRHHEIYLSDPRKAVPEKMKTVIRQPVERPPG